MTSQDDTQGSTQGFLETIGAKQLISMFELVPDVIFWIKDKHSQVVHANKSYADYLGLKSLQAVIGKNDYAFSPAYLAKQFITDDRKVMAGEIVTDRLEMNTLPNGSIGWFSTSKRPLLDEQGEIIGSYGITRHLQRSEKLLSGVDVMKGPVDYVRQHYRQDISVEKLAEVAHLSVSALERRFRKYLSKTPKQFINEIRLENARKMLVDSTLTISEVAYRCGFSDHSYFSRQFRMLFDELPSELRATLASDKKSEQITRNVYY